MIEEKPWPAVFDGSPSVNRTMVLSRLDAELRLLQLLEVLRQMLADWVSRLQSRTRS